MPSSRPRTTEPRVAALRRCTRAVPAANCGSARDRGSPEPSSGTERSTILAAAQRAASAVTLGLATRVDPDPREAALELARGIAARSPHAIRAAKRLLDLAGRVDLAAGFAAEQKEIADLIGSPNQAEAVAAEFARRPPQFTDPD